MHSAAVVGSLARRGFEATREVEFADLDISIWGLALVALTAVVFLALVTMAEYTFGRLIPNLIMVESSSHAAAFQPLPTTDVDEKDSKMVEPELLLVKQQPITNSFRATLQHLRAKAGFWSRARGFGLYVVYAFIFQHTAALLTMIPNVPNYLATILASLVCAQLSMAWTHIVMSESNSIGWVRRANFSFAAWKKVAAPTALLAVTQQLNLMLPAYLFFSYGFYDMTPESFSKLSCTERHALVLKATSIVVLTAMISLLIVLPADVTLTRMQASLLSENEEPIIPFDRTFGGKVESEAMGGTGVLGMLDAWKTFNWNSRVQLVKAYIKAVAIQVALAMLMTSILSLQILYLAGGDIQKLTRPVGNTEEIPITITNV